MNKKQQPIDFVIAYVNNQDLVWRKSFIDYCSKHRLNEKIVELLGSRYGGITFIYDQIKLVNKNMTWINKIYLLLSNIEQIDKSKLPDNVIIVLHEQFIPYIYRPTFNSCTIEMFLWNIPNLSEYFIYANDDMLPTGKLEPTDFFDKGKIKIKWRMDEFQECSNVYSHQCHNNCMFLVKELNIKFNKNTILRPIHSFTPMRKLYCRECYGLLKKYIEPKIRVFRTEYQCNQYIYPLYERFVFGTIDSDIDFYYTELNEDFDLNHQIVCINGEHKKEYIDKYKEEIKKLL